MEVASNPEFLAQGSAVHDTLHAERIIIGTESNRLKRCLCRSMSLFICL
nr:hypothetical protein [Paenibacillus sp. Soil522]